MASTYKTQFELTNNLEFPISIQKVTFDNYDFPDGNNTPQQLNNKTLKKGESIKVPLELREGARYCGFTTVAGVNEDIISFKVFQRDAYERIIRKEIPVATSLIAVQNCTQEKMKEGVHGRNTITIKIESAN